MRIGVPGGEGVTGVAGVAIESIENGFRFGSGAGEGVRRRVMSVWTCSKVVVTLVRASAVIPDHLQPTVRKKEL